MHLFGVQSYDFFRIFSRFAPFFFVRRRKSVATPCTTRQKRSRCGSRYLALQSLVFCVAIRGVSRCNSWCFAAPSMASCVAIRGLSQTQAFFRCPAGGAGASRFFSSMDGKGGKAAARVAARANGREPQGSRAGTGCRAGTLWPPGHRAPVNGRCFSRFFFSCLAEGWPGHPVPASAARCGTSCPCPPPSF